MNADYLHKFMFPELDIRGHLVLLDQSLADATAFAEYPASVYELLAQSLCTTVLLSATLKIEGSTSLQARSTGPVSMLMAEANHRHEIRGIAHFSETPASSSIDQAFADKATLAITLSPERGQRYQGIVALSHPTLAACVEDYFERSEQLPTHLWLFQHKAADSGQTAGRMRTGGLLIQCLPTDDRARQALEWERIGHLANTLKVEEVFDLPVVDILYRLFHEDDIQLLSSDKVKFSCSCSEQRFLDALQSLPLDERESLRKEQEVIDLTCQFCGKAYHLPSSCLEPAS
ncbi:Hsp33 family molecular chaperone HslO [Allohahella marinimesophila]|uniref:Hsp33 family molecular chaperone HslO n=1 Tax=Allohahella marinimesophila TaxID=1054972 RepID=A0ABP7PHW3_9GAMM